MFKIRTICCRAASSPCRGLFSLRPSAHCGDAPRQPVQTTKERQFRLPRRVPLFPHCGSCLWTFRSSRPLAKRPSACIVVLLRGCSPIGAGFLSGQLPLIFVVSICTTHKQKTILLVIFVQSEIIANAIKSQVFLCFGKIQLVCDPVQYDRSQSFSRFFSRNCKSMYKY